MKKNMGFTLVELLAVIAILAILVIIALPNVMGMFNTAKESSFTTELKQIYKVAQQQWMSDSMFSTGEQIYSRCDGCTGKSLDLSGRTELKYYIKINQAGKVVEYYATDGTYQFAYEGDLLATNINGVERVSELNDSDILRISNNAPYYGDDSSCRYKVLTDKGSFSTNSEVKELCITLTDDGYKFRNEISSFSVGNRDDRYKWLYISANLEQLKNGGYVRVYRDESKTQLIGKLDSTTIPDLNRAPINGYISYTKNNIVEKILGDYDRNDLYFEHSEGLDYDSLYTYDSGDVIGRTYTGPWITKADELAAIKNAISSLEALGYAIEDIENCDNYVEPGGLGFNGSIPIVSRQSGGQNYYDYSYPNCKHNSYFIKYYVYDSTPQ